MPAWRGPSQGTSSACASSSSSSRAAPTAPAATAAPPAALCTKRRRETRLTPGSPLDAERPLHPGERLGERLDALLDRALLGVGELVVGREAAA